MGQPPASILDHVPSLVTLPTARLMRWSKGASHLHPDPSRSAVDARDQWRPHRTAARELGVSPQTLPTMDIPHCTAHKAYAIAFDDPHTIVAVFQTEEQANKALPCFESILFGTGPYVQALPANPSFHPLPAGFAPFCAVARETGDVRVTSISLFDFGVLSTADESSPFAPGCPFFPVLARDEDHAYQLAVEHFNRLGSTAT